MNVGEPCWRDAAGVAHLNLPWRVVLTDGTTRTDPSQWSEDAAVMADTGWQRSSLTAEDLAAMTPTAPEPVGWVTPGGWRLGTTATDLSLFTGLYVFAARRQQIGQSHPVTVIDTSGEPHSMTFAEFDALMLAYAAAVEASYGTP